MCYFNNITRIIKIILYKTSHILIDSIHNCINSSFINFAHDYLKTETLCRIYIYMRFLCMYISWGHPPVMCNLRII